ncbi:PQQ-binding-like beta-propeller repeat protein [Novosphingobium resinovorum]|uniref:outer membrane protein assembly factor BamB family protein n=1 Tax=Novosphingobium resinovorum TaxID=158500 RepID=UPI002ED585CD|nr:PQQ-binding-like beta-propeller repeat protein [Novosphingobium resinovorum]
MTPSLPRRIWLPASLALLGVGAAAALHVRAGTDTASGAATRVDLADGKAPGAGEWGYFGGTLGSTQFSPLAQIDRSNVTRLAVAWRYDTGERPTTAGPLVADGTMYVVRDGDSIAALDAATGRQLWIAPHVTDRTRGLSYWQSADLREKRLFVSRDHALHALDAATGAAIPGFGDGGKVDLREGLGRDPARIGSIEPVTGGKVVGDVIVMGSNPGEGYGSPPGDVRAYNVRSGRLVWQFHTIPHPGEAGYETWPADAWKTAGGANNWGGMAIDAARKLVFVGLGAPTYDFWGGDREGANFYADSLVALDLDTGRPVWHFQFVHHDLWDYDLDSSPVLMRVRHRGRVVDAVVQATKQGMVFVFDRATGKPLFPIEERAVPASRMSDEHAWPTQPFSTLPPFARTRFGVADLDPNLPAAERATFAEQIAAARNEGPFTPPGTTDTVEMPGNHGGTNWGMVAADPEAGRFYVASFDLPALLRLEKADAEPAYFATPLQRGQWLYGNTCAICHGAERQGGNGVPSLQGVVGRLGADAVRRLVREGRATMPAFAGSLEPNDIAQIEAYLADPAAAGPARPQAAHSASGPATAASAPAPAARDRWYSSYGYLISPSTALPAIRPPWSTITAYDLNTGTILWQRPLGGTPGYPIAQTGVARSKGGLVVTRGGLVFAASSDDRKIHGYDATTGALLWEAELPAPAQGVPAVYEAGGRQFLAVPAAYHWASGSSPFGPMRRKDGRNGYVVFALPARR